MKKRTYAARTTHLVRLWQFGQLVNHTSFVRNNSVTIFLTCAPPEKCNETQRAIVSAPAEWLEVCESQPLLRLLIFISVIFLCSFRFIYSSFDSCRAWKRKQLRRHRCHVWISENQRIVSRAAKFGEQMNENWWRWLWLMTLVVVWVGPNRCRTFWSPQIDWLLNGAHENGYEFLDSISYYRVCHVTTTIPS